MKTISHDSEYILSIIKTAYHKFESVAEGQNASYIPYLKEIDPKLFGISVCLTDGTLIEYGDTSFQFGIESISKVPTALLALKQNGTESILQKIGTNATGMDFGSLFAILLEKGYPSTPLVNAGAIAACSLIEPLGDAAGKWQMIQQNIDDLCGSKTEVLHALYQNETETNYHNRSITWLLKSYDRIYDDPEVALDIYTRQCSIGVTTSQLAVMAATIANKGKNPKTGLQVFDAALASKLVSMIATVGLYEETGDWMFESGIPAKSGVGGGILAVYPGEVGICVFSPPLNRFGNSVKGKKVVQYIANALGLSIYE